VTLGETVALGLVTSRRKRWPDGGLVREASSTKPLIWRVSVILRWSRYLESATNAACAGSLAVVHPPGLAGSGRTK
jgi:hypothetical protein